jgi:hypothetical protein
MAAQLTDEFGAVEGGSKQIDDRYVRLFLLRHPQGLAATIHLQKVAASINENFADQAMVTFVAVDYQDLHDVRSRSVPIADAAAYRERALQMRRDK